jgi:hypothetical protein
MHAPRSRFLPDALLGRFERQSYGLAHAWHGDTAGPTQAPVDIGARMRAMWR